MKKERTKVSLIEFDATFWYDFFFQRQAHIICQVLVKWGSLDWNTAPTSSGTNALGTVLEENKVDKKGFAKA